MDQTSLRGHVIGILPGLLVDGFSFRGRVPHTHAFFLSHFHSDHYTGLDHSFPWALAPAGARLFCSEVTAALAVHALLLLPALGAGAATVYAHLAVAAALTGVGLAASPLVTLREVVATRDASSLPPVLCLTVTLQCAAWTLYAYLRADWSTLANNAVGVALGTAQCALILALPRRGAEAGEGKRSDGGSTASAEPGGAGPAASDLLPA